MSARRSKLPSQLRPKLPSHRPRSRSPHGRTAFADISPRCAMHFRAFPEEAANAVQIVRTQIKYHGFGMVLDPSRRLCSRSASARNGCSGGRYSGRGGIPSRPVAVPTPSAREPRRQPAFTRSRRSSFSPSSARASSSSFSWPPLLRLMVITYLVAFIVLRLVMAIGRIVLAPHADAGAARSRRASPTDPDDRRRSAFLVSADWPFSPVTSWQVGRRISLLPALGFSPEREAFSPIWLVSACSCSRSKSFGGVPAGSATQGASAQKLADHHLSRCSVGPLGRRPQRPLVARNLRPAAAAPAGDYRPSRAVDRRSARMLPPRRIRSGP